MATKPTQLCVVTIGYQIFVMPSNKGMQVVELMQHAIDARQSYSDSMRAIVYDLQDQPCVEFALLKPTQIRAPNGEMTPAPRQRALGLAPKLLK